MLRRTMSATQDNECYGSMLCKARSAMRCVESLSSGRAMQMNASPFPDVPSDLQVTQSLVQGFQFFQTVYSFRERRLQAAH